MPTSFTSSYLVPAVLLNPLVVLHAINTAVSHFIPSAMRTVASTSLHKGFEILGPPGNQQPYLDMHKDDALCWRYTAVMVVVQVLAYSKVCDNREMRKLARQAKRAEKERIAALRAADTIPIIVGSASESKQYAALKTRPDGRARIDGTGNITPETSVGSSSPTLDGNMTDITDLTDTSEEETII